MYNRNNLEKYSNNITVELKNNLGEIYTLPINASLRNAFEKLKFNPPIKKNHYVIDWSKNIFSDFITMIYDINGRLTIENYEILTTITDNSKIEKFIRDNINNLPVEYVVKHGCINLYDTIPKSMHSKYRKFKIVLRPRFTEMKIKLDDEISLNYQLSPRVTMDGGIIPTDVEYSYVSICKIMIISDEWEFAKPYEYSYKNGYQENDITDNQLRTEYIEAIFKKIYKKNEKNKQKIENIIKYGDPPEIPKYDKPYGLHDTGLDDGYFKHLFDVLKNNREYYYEISSDSEDSDSYAEYDVKNGRCTREEILTRNVKKLERYKRLHEKVRDFKGNSFHLSKKTFISFDYNGIMYYSQSGTDRIKCYCNYNSELTLECMFKRKESV